MHLFNILILLQEYIRLVLVFLWNDINLIKKKSFDIKRSLVPLQFRFIRSFELFHC